MRIRTRHVLFALVALIALGAPACGDDGAKEGVVRVPQDQETIQAAVDVAEEGDLILVDEGVYEEAVDVTTRGNFTIRGVDRNKVILDGGFELENGIRVLDTDGVVVENMTARNYVSNGFFWTGSDYYRGSYLTAYRNGDYGIYAFDAYHGQFDHSLRSGSPDAGFYIGECFPCDAVIDDVVSEYNGLGYSGTNSGGDLYIVNSTFREQPGRHRAQLGLLRALLPEPPDHHRRQPRARQQQPRRPRHRRVAAGAGQRHPRSPGRCRQRSSSATSSTTTTGPASAWCRSPRRTPTTSASRVGLGHPLLGDPRRGRSRPSLRTVHRGGPHRRGMRRDLEPEGERGGRQRRLRVQVADLAVGTVDLPGSGETTESLGNCFSGNTFTTSAPALLEALAPVQRRAHGHRLERIAARPDQPPGRHSSGTAQNSYKTTPEPPAQESMPDATTAPAPRFTAPMKVDLASITLPAKPAGN